MSQYHLRSYSKNTQPPTESIRTVKGFPRMDYISHIPAPPLNAYIDDLYYIDGPSPVSALEGVPDAIVTPDGELRPRFPRCMRRIKPHLLRPAPRAGGSGCGARTILVDWPRQSNFSACISNRLAFIRSCVFPSPNCTIRSCRWMPSGGVSPPKSVNVCMLRRRYRQD